jgi:hypothetical protein
MLSVSRPLALACLVLTLYSCNGDGPTNGTTTSSSTTSTVRPPASISISIANPRAFVSGGGNAFQFDLTLTESAGTGANIDFARLELFRATGELEEVQEIGANDIIAGVGNNRLEGSTTETATVTFFFRATVKKGRTLRVTVGFTDDLGNRIEAVKSFIFG